jgi:NMD protein affecting ribosome stability and mRNA decay
MALLLLVVPLALLGAELARPSPALAENVVNVTFHVPAQVEINPCTPGDIVNLSGDIHVVITTTADRRGGYHVTNSLNSQLSGASIVTGLKYTNSTTEEEEWYASSPFPAVHTHTYDFELVSQTGVDNYVLHMTTHETVDANGVPTATVDNFSMDCKG